MSHYNRRPVGNDLSEDDIQFILANTDFERDKVIEWYANFRQKCPSGKLDKNDFICFYRQLIRGNHPDEDAYCSAVFDVFDSDGNGLIDFGEFLIAFWIRAKGNIKDKLSWLFDIYDLDKSGSISLRELKEMLKLVCNMKGLRDDPDEKAESIMYALDRSRDGRISRHEFIAGCTRDQRLRSIFSPF